MVRPPEFFQGTEMPTAGWWEALWPNPADVLARVGVQAGMTIVDLCSGDGWFTLPLAKLARHVTAIDIDPSLLAVARTRLAESGVSNCDLVEGDAYELPQLIERPVDFVFMANAFHGVPDGPRLARAVADMLVPGGSFAVVNWHRRPREKTVVLGEPRGPKTESRLSPGQTTAAIAMDDLRLSQIVEIPPYHYAALFVKS